MIRLFLLLLLLQSTSVFCGGGDDKPKPKPKPTPDPAPKHDCKDCVEEVTWGGPKQEYGACCLGDKSLGSDYTKERCGHVWAGPGTGAEACRNRAPCCYAEQNGKCTNEKCFDCVKNGGTPVDSCHDCKAVTTTTVKPVPTKPHPKTPAPTPKDKEDKHTGCCCVKKGANRVTTPQDCWKCGGSYRGDGTKCSETDICQKLCCDKSTRECGECDPSGDIDRQQFIGFGDECPAEACGVTCCLNAQAHNADSTAVCLKQGGVVVDAPLEQANCGGGCCTGINFEIVLTEAACNGRYLGSGVGYQPGICGGACCRSTGCEIEAEKDCVDLPPTKRSVNSLSVAVYQGNDTTCALSTPNGPTDISACANDGCCCVPGVGALSVSDSTECFKLGGIFKGEGSQCSEESCWGGVCCTGRGGFEVNKKVECDLKKGTYAGDGTDLSMPGVCDHEGGACWCEHDQQCLEVPNAAACWKFGGEEASFRGVGTKCTDQKQQQEEEGGLVTVVDEGACCISRTGARNWRACEIVPNMARCTFLGGVWQGKNSVCKDDTCKVLRGACCTDDGCQENLTADECDACGGKWGKPGSLCSDEYACQKGHHGACCREAQGCSVVSIAACTRDGGRFQGFNTTCQDLAHGICKVCQPCVQDAPTCSESKPCANKHATCVREYGKCMVLATPIRSEYDYWVDNQGDGDDDEGDNVKGPAEPPKEWAGRLSCGAADTIGLPCIAKPLHGYGRVGTCTAPPADSGLGEHCESECRYIRAFTLGCQCEHAWLKTCASISGRIVQDVDHDYKYSDADTGAPGAIVTLLRYVGEDADYEFVSTQKTDKSGHYAFVGVESGKYKVRVRAPRCLAFADNTNFRIVTVECLDNAANALRAATHGTAIRKHVSHQSAQLEQTARGNHLADSVDFLAFKDCDLSADQIHEADANGGDLGGDRKGNGKHGRGDSDGNALTIVLVVLAVFALCGCCVLIVCMLSAATPSTRDGKSKISGSRRSKRSGSRLEVDTGTSKGPAKKRKSTKK